MNFFSPPPPPLVEHWGRVVADQIIRFFENLFRFLSKIFAYRRLFDISTHWQPSENLLTSFKEKAKKINIYPSLQPADLLIFRPNSVLPPDADLLLSFVFLLTSFDQFRLPTSFPDFSLPTTISGPPDVFYKIMRKKLTPFRDFPIFAPTTFLILRQPTTFSKPPDVKKKKWKNRRLPDIFAYRCLFDVSTYWQHSWELTTSFKNMQ